MVSCQTMTPLGAVAFGPSGLLANMRLPRVQIGPNWPHTNERLAKTIWLCLRSNAGAGSPPPSDPVSGSSPSIHVPPPSDEKKNPDGTCRMAVFPLNAS